MNSEKMCQNSINQRLDNFLRILKKNQMNLKTREKHVTRKMGKAEKTYLENRITRKTNLRNDSNFLGC